MSMYKPFIPSENMVRECRENKESNEIRTIFKELGMQHYEYINFRQHLIDYINKHGYDKFPQNPTYPSNRQIFIRHLPSLVFHKPIVNKNPKGWDIDLPWYQKLIRFLLGIIKKSQ